MSLERSISKFKKPIGSGASRNAYYSRKYGVVVKMMKQFPDYFLGDQNQKEIELFEKMTPAERKATPMLGHGMYKGKSYIVAERVTTFWKLGLSIPDFLDAPRFFSVKKVPEEYKTIFRVIKKYKICDVHAGNIGKTKDGRIVILDFGIV